jgi:peptide/nickel transport system substrate-binding protein
MTVRSVLPWLALLLLAGCAPASPTPDRVAPAPGGAAPEPEKTIVVGQLNAIKSYGPWDFGQVGGGGAGLAEVHTVALVTEDLHGGLEPRLAAALPSFDQSTIVIQPDGRMRTTWKLRPNVRWHDGAPFTSADLEFSFAVSRDPELLAGGTANSGFSQLESIEAIDPLTAVATWRTVSSQAVALGWRELWPFPQHILAEAFQDRDVFQAMPYFTTDYVHLGPYRLMDFGMGEQQVFRRFDDYFLGRPKVGTIILRTIPNGNTLVANLMAGAVDVAPDRTISSEVALRLRDEFQQSGEGVVLHRQDAWVHASFQFDPQFAQPVELARDVRLRRGLGYAFDREAIREFALPGISDTSADTLLLARDRRNEVAGQPFARFRFDAARAVQELAAGGWQRGADGRMVNAAGRQIQIQVKVEDERWQQEVALIADYWRRIGIDALEYMPSRALARDREHRAAFPAVTVRARGVADRVFTGYDGRLQATLQNRWQGPNLAHYANPALDSLIDRLYATLDEREQGLILRDMMEIFATDVPVLPLYYAASFGVVRKGVYALQYDFAVVGGTARNAHLWDRV